MITGFVVEELAACDPAGEKSSNIVATAAGRKLESIEANGPATPASDRSDPKLIPQVGRKKYGEVDAG